MKRSISRKLIKAGHKVKAAFQQEPVVVNAVRAVVVLLATFGLDIADGTVETIINGGSIVFAAWSLLNARSKVSPVDEA